ncbi:MAG: hypothetical protein WBM64_12685, partial [Woeseiaceae bacterium]
VLQEKSRPESGRRSKQKMYLAGFGSHSNIETSMSQQFSALSKVRLAIRFVIGNDCLQEISQKGRVLRGFTQHPPLSHASGMAICPLRLPTSHLRAYRIGTGGMLLHLVCEGE